MVVGAAEAAPSTASALDDFKAHVAKRQQGLSALLASNQPNANGGAASTPSEPIVGKDVAKVRHARACSACSTRGVGLRDIISSCNAPLRVSLLRGLRISPICSARSENVT